MAELRDANTNPWYVLMTLYGEQDHADPEVNKTRARENRKVWNAWSCQGLSDAEATMISKLAEIDVVETRGWAEIADEVAKKHLGAMAGRNKRPIFKYPGFPNFEKVTDFSSINIVNDVMAKKFIFTQEVRFNFSKFERIANFDAAIFTKDTFFPAVTFLRAANFEAANFMKSVIFIHTIFKQSADFESAMITQNTYFNSATFDGPAKFVGTQFGVLGMGEQGVSVFTEATFARLASFRDAEFVAHYPVLEGTEFRETVVLTAKDRHWPDTWQLLLDEAAEDAPHVPTKEIAKESCAVLRHALARQGMPEDEHFFFRREMGFAAQIGGFWQRLPYRLFGVFSEYGQSIARPSLWLLGLWLVPALILLSYFAWVGSFGDSVWRGIDAFGLSFANIFTVFGFHRLYFEPEQIRELPALLQVIGAAQTVLALPLLFFLGLALRKRFRLR